jgi:hypothetical protein
MSDDSYKPRFRHALLQLIREWEGDGNKQEPSTMISLVLVEVVAERLEHDHDEFVYKSKSSEQKPSGSDCL